MRYQKIHTQIWHDEKFVSLSEDAKFLFLYLLTCPHGNTIGAFVIPKGYICADLGWPMKRLEEPFQELLGKQLPKQFQEQFQEGLSEPLNKGLKDPSGGLILYDENVHLLIIKNHLKYNQLENINQVKSAVKVVASLPKSPLFSHILELFHKPFHKPLREQLREQLQEQLPKLLPKLLPKPETETETETETEKENIRARATPSPKKPKMKFSDSVFLTEEEVTKLTELLTPHGFQNAVDKLDYSISVKGGKYKDHYKTLLNWHKRGFLNNGSQPQQSHAPPKPSEPDIIDLVLRGEL